jgi:hypothetical protein
MARDGNALQAEAASSISSGLSIVGKIIGHGALTIFGHVKGEIRASTIVIAEGAQLNPVASLYEGPHAGSEPRKEVPRSGKWTAISWRLQSPRARSCPTQDRTRHSP